MDNLWLSGTAFLSSCFLSYMGFRLQSCWSRRAVTWDKGIVIPRDETSGLGGGIGHTVVGMMQTSLRTWLCGTTVKEAREGNGGGMIKMVL